MSFAHMPDCFLFCTHLVVAQCILVGIRSFVLMWQLTTSFHCCLPSPTPCRPTAARPADACLTTRCCWYKASINSQHRSEPTQQAASFIAVPGTTASATPVNPGPCCSQQEASRHAVASETHDTMMSVLHAHLNGVPGIMLHDDLHSCTFVHHVSPLQLSISMIPFVTASQQLCLSMPSRACPSASLGVTATPFTPLQLRAGWVAPWGALY